MNFEKFTEGVTDVHYFNINVAKDVGVCAAVVFSNILHWVKTNKSNGKNFFEGKYWTYNSKRALTELFPEFSIDQVKRALEKLKDEGYLLSGNFNENAYDRTLWYTLTDRAEDFFMSNVHCAKSPNRSCDNANLPNPSGEIAQCTLGEIAQCTNTNINTNINTGIKEKDKKEKSTSMKKFNVTISDLIELGVSEEVAERWITYRKSKKSSYTKRVIESYLKQAKILNVSLESVLIIQMEKGWTGFEADWVIRSNAQHGYIDEYGVRRVAPTIYTKEHTNEQRRKNGF